MVVRKKKRRRERIDCLKCYHYYVTWDEDHPRGCRALTFKTKHFPADVVFHASGMNCLFYENKKKKKQSDSHQ